MDTQEHLRNVSDRRGFVVLEKANTDLVRVTCMVYRYWGAEVGAGVLRPSSG
jgi:hypothetical protein